MMTRYSFFSSVCPQMFRKWVFSNICLNLLIPLILLNFKVAAITNLEICYPKVRTDRHTDIHTERHYEIPNSTPSVENSYTVVYFYSCIVIVVVICTVV